MTTETPTAIKGWFSPGMNGDLTEGPSSEYSEAHVEAALASVRALIADLRYIMGNEEASRWPSLASAALQHHSPSVPDEQLSADMRELQKHGRAALGGICKGDFNSIREAILELRAVEARLH